MFKKKIIVAALSCAALGVSFTASAATKAEQELVAYLSSMGIQESFSWERIEGDSLSDATIYGVTYISDKGADDEKKILIKEMDFDEYKVTDSGVSVDVKYQGITDEEGTHLLLSEQLEPESYFRSLGYEQLDDIEVKLKYTMEKASGGLEGSFVIDQDEVADISFEFKTEGIDMLIDQLVDLDIAALDPNMILVSAMATKIHRLELSFDDDGYNKRRIDYAPNHISSVEEQYQGCVESLGEFDLKDLEKGCVAIRDYLLNTEDKLHISMNPAKPFSIGEYMPMFMLLGSSGPQAMEKLIQRVLSEINLQISNQQ